MGSENPIMYPQINERSSTKLHTKSVSLQSVTGHVYRLFTAVKQHNTFFQTCPEIMSRVQDNLVKIFFFYMITIQTELCRH